MLQKRMAFYNDQENVVSAAMTVVQNLLDKYKVDPRSIGRYKVHLVCYKVSYTMYAVYSASLYRQHVSILDVVAKLKC